jgi:hypothetical protein
MSALYEFFRDSLAGVGATVTDAQAQALVEGLSKRLTEEVKASAAARIAAETPGEIVDGWQIGKNYFIRTVTHHYTGTLTAVYDKELVLMNAAWIADDGRFMQAVATGSFSDVEPYPDRPVILGRGAVLDATVITFPLPRTQK